MDAETRADFTAFVESRSAALSRAAMALTGHRQQAEDLLQTALARSMRHWARLRTGQPEAYVRTVMYRQYATWWRRRSRPWETPTAELPEIAGQDHTAGVDLSLALTTALRRLAPRHRAVLILRYLEDRPNEEIADILGCTQATVRSQTTRALRRLRELCPELDTRTVQETWQ
ncbi:MAG TPA: SigE family RNA polymerase sigma factor [Mycobacteriales bacterium]|nr:SigE family RNA polymerase sigma factor [Mycobacteriales bacterium]